MKVGSLTLAALALATPVLAGTKIQMTLVPLPPDCLTSYSMCRNDGSPCTQDSDCTGTLAPSSKVSLDGKLKLKGTLTKVRDAAGNRITTDPANATDDYILKLTVSPCIANTAGFIDPDDCSPNRVTVYVKIELKNGNGKIVGDLSQVLAGHALGTSIGVVRSGDGITRMSDATSCAGDNSAAAIDARKDNVACEDGTLLAVPGVQKEI